MQINTYTFDNLIKLEFTKQNKNCNHVLHGQRTTNYLSISVYFHNIRYFTTPKITYFVVLCQPVVDFKV